MLAYGDSTKHLQNRDAVTLLKYQGHELHQDLKIGNVSHTPHI